VQWLTPRWISKIRNTVEGEAGAIINDCSFVLSSAAELTKVLITVGKSHSSGTVTVVLRISFKSKVESG
jgi:hypothetical protein